MPPPRLCLPPRFIEEARTPRCLEVGLWEVMRFRCDLESGTPRWIRALQKEDRDPEWAHRLPCEDTENGAVASRGSQQTRTLTTSWPWTRQPLQLCATVQGFPPPRLWRGALLPALPRQVGGGWSAVVPKPAASVRGHSGASQGSSAEMMCACGLELEARGGRWVE